ncbi:thiamine pyrophosphate-dependent dehydrogenase E1 component subunit alpha, partial [Verrucosispora sp. SN26_14.1]
MGLPDDYRAMARIRRFEERLAALKDDGEIPGSIHLCNGQEAIPVGAARALRDGDHVTATYRGHGWALARGVDMTGLFAEMMGRDSAVNGGRAASPYLSDPGRWFMGENSIVGAGVPIATGAALTAQRTGSGAVSVVSIGDGAMNQGNVHEAINLAAVLDLPLVLVVENNVYSEMSRIEDMVRIRQLAERAAGYGIPGRVVDGNDPDAVAEAVAEAVTRAREGSGPSIVEAMTERLVGHYSGDVQHYRPAGEIAAAREREPLAR